MRDASCVIKQELIADGKRWIAEKETRVTLHVSRFTVFREGGKR